MQADPALRLDLLSSDDAEAVFELHQRVAALTPHGHLALRSLDEFRSILDEQARSMSVGAWQGDRLVAYSLSNVDADSTVEGATPVMRLLADSGQTVWRGKGMVVDPAYRGRKTAGLLRGMQEDLLVAMHVWHSIGLFATTNFPSLDASLRAGMWLVGVERDAYCENFVGYGGNLQQRFGVSDERIELPADDLANIRRHLGDGWVGVAMNRSEAGGQTTISFGRLAPTPG